MKSREELKKELGGIFFDVISDFIQAGVSAGYAIFAESFRREGETPPNIEQYEAKLWVRRSVVISKNFFETNIDRFVDAIVYNIQSDQALSDLIELYKKHPTLLSNSSLPNPVLYQLQAELTMLISTDTEFDRLMNEDLDREFPE